MLVERNHATLHKLLSGTIITPEALLGYCPKSMKSSLRRYLITKSFNIDVCDGSEYVTRF